MPTTPIELEGHQRMLMHRCKTLGMKELDIILGTWAD